MCAFYTSWSGINAFYAPEMEFFLLRTGAKSVLLHILLTVKRNCKYRMIAIKGMICLDVTGS